MSREEQTEPNPNDNYPIRLNQDKLGGNKGQIERVELLFVQDVVGQEAPFEAEDVEQDWNDDDRYRHDLDPRLHLFLKVVSVVQRFAIKWWALVNWCILFVVEARLIDVFL